MCRVLVQHSSRALCRPMPPKRHWFYGQHFLPWPSAVDGLFAQSGQIMDMNAKRFLPPIPECNRFHCKNIVFLYFVLITAKLLKMTTANCGTGTVVDPREKSRTHALHRIYKWSWDDYHSRAHNILPRVYNWWSITTAGHITVSLGFTTDHESNPTAEHLSSSDLQLITSQLPQQSTFLPRTYNWSWVHSHSRAHDLLPRIYQCIRKHGSTPATEHMIVSLGSTSVSLNMGPPPQQSTWSSP